MSNDLILMAARAELLQYADDMADVSLDDLSELRVKADGIREVSDRLNALADRIADEQAERTNEPYDIGWLVDFNKGER